MVGSVDVTGLDASVLLGRTLPFVGVCLFQNKREQKFNVSIGWSMKTYQLTRPFGQKFTSRDLSMWRDRIVWRKEMGMTVVWLKALKWRRAHATERVAIKRVRQLGSELATFCALVRVLCCPPLSPYHRDQPSRG